MLPAFLITFREFLEASLIVATIIGVLLKLGKAQAIRTVWTATISATAMSFLLLLLGSVAGLKVHELFEQHEALFEGSVMIISAVFITWAVFFLHKTFARHKLTLLQKVRSTIDKTETKGIFLLVFTAVFREGLEISLFLSTIFFSSNPLSIGMGFVLGACLAILVSLFLFTTTLRLPVYQTFRLTSILLILFAAGLIAHGFHELSEAGIVPTVTFLPSLHLFFLPAPGAFLGSIVRGVFGLSQTMHGIELLLWSTYAWAMWTIVTHKKT